LAMVSRPPWQARQEMIMWSFGSRPRTMRRASVLTHGARSTAARCRNWISSHSPQSGFTPKPRCAGCRAWARWWAAVPQRSTVAPANASTTNVVMTVGLASSYEVQHLGRTLSMRRGEAVVMTGSEPALLRAPTHGEYISMRAPLRSMSPLVAGLDAAYGRPIPADSPALRLLTHYLRSLDQTEALDAPSLRRLAVSHVHDLMALAIGATRDAAVVAKDRGARAARLYAIKEDIANHLDHPDLSVATIARRHRIIPRYVQRLFEGEGTTFTDYVLEHRLARAHRLLTDPHGASRKISTVAFESGFGDLSYFNRTFRRRYGLAPSEVRAEARSDELRPARR